MLKNIYYKNTWLVAAGFLLVTLALQIRPGALFIIPALWIWAMYSYKDRYSLGLRILIFTLPILAGFGVNWYIPRFFGVPSPLRMRSIPNQFLRIVTGGGNPQTIISRFPELDNIPIPAEKTRATYNLAWNLFTANPLKSFQGLFNNYKNYYSSDRLGGFFFAFGSNKFFTTLAFLLTGYAVSMTAALRRRPLYGFLFSAILGLFASVPLINWVGFRSHAGSIIVLVLLMCLGMLWLFRWPDMTEKESETRENSFVGMNIAALIIVGSLCLSPLLVRLISKPVTSFTEPTCAPGEMYVTTRIKSGSYLIITKDQDNNLALPFIPLSDFKKSLRIKEIFDFKNYLMKVEPETILMNAYDLRTGSNLTNWMLSKRNIFPDKEGIFSACGTFALAGSDNQIFLVSSWQKTQ